MGQPAAAKRGAKCQCFTGRKRNAQTGGVRRAQEAADGAPGGCKPGGHRSVWPEGQQLQGIDHREQNIFHAGIFAMQKVSKRVAFFECEL